ncbi:MAG: hypothetical protein NZ773_11105, partial [Dehalococcoidia bacterium]|nr:hypothetical protein [Dehalococcoidia bacterium]
MGDIVGLLATVFLIVAAIVIANAVIIGVLVALPIVMLRRALRRARRRYAPFIRPGRVSEAMRDFAGLSNRAAVQFVLRRSLPNWPISAAIVEAAGELADLRHGATAALAAGVPAGIITTILAESAEASEAVWRIADRVTATAAQRIDGRLLAPALDPEIEKLTNLIQAVRQTRESIAQLTLSHATT